MMRSLPTLATWIEQLLPDHGPCAQAAARLLVQSLLVRFSVNLSELARQTDRDTKARGIRQFFARWLSREHWEPDRLYACLITYRSPLREQLLASARQRRCTALLVDFTHLQNRWSVLQVSVPWQGRALPLYRLVLPRKGDTWDQEGVVRQTCLFLATHLPGPRSRWVLVMDRGFPSHTLINDLQAAGWHFVLRLPRTWKVRHARYHGLLWKAASTLLDERCPAGELTLLRHAQLGRREKGRCEGSIAHVVVYQGPGHQEPWLLVTSLGRAARAVRIQLWRPFIIA